VGLGLSWPVSRAYCTNEGSLPTYWPQGAARLKETPWVTFQCGVFFAISNMRHISLHHHPLHRAYRRACGFCSQQAPLNSCAAGDTGLLWKSCLVTTCVLQHCLALLIVHADLRGVRPWRGCCGHVLPWLRQPHWRHVAGRPAA